MACTAPVVGGRLVEVRQVRTDPVIDAPGRRTVARAPLVLWIVGLGFFVWVVAASINARAAQGAGTKALNLLLFSALSTVEFLLLSTRIVVAHDRLTLVNFLRSVVFSSSSLQAIDVTRGFNVRLKDGRQYGATCLGRSLIGDVVGYRRAKRAKETIERVLRPSSAQHHQSSLRPALWLTPLTVLCALGVLIYVPA
jgi:hypothetical protein